jgi:LmbE family N-acetylglucosaminyl deacetylase
MLMLGPTVQPDLLAIVLRFRTHVVALSADIAKIYRCVLVHPDHRVLQRIVWRESSDVEITDYRLTTVTYGTSSASFLATRCFVQLADEYKEYSTLLQNPFVLFLS